MISLDMVHSAIPEVPFRETEECLWSFNKDLWESPFPFMELPFRQKNMDEMRLLAESLRQPEMIVLLGIGGSSLGAQAIAEALLPPMASKHKRPMFLPLDNIDPAILKAAMERIGDRIEKTVFIVASKSGETSETLSQFMAFTEMVRRAGARGSVVVIAGRKAGTLREIAEREGYPLLPIPDDVPGRYSVLTPCGLFPSLLIGVDVREILHGAADMAIHIRSKHKEENLAIALASCLHHLTETRKVLVLMPYCERLGLFSSWLAQLFSESLGKRGRGFTPLKAKGVTDQHSLLQLLVDGPKDKSVLFFYVEDGDVSMGDPFPYAQGLKYLRGKGIRTLFFSELLGTRFSLWEASCPSLTIYIERLDAYAMGALLFLFEMVTVFIAHLIQVDPFTQEGVERGKLYTRVLLGKEGLEEEKTRMEGALKGGTSIRFP